MEMLLLSEERECGKMKKKKIMFIILCMLTVLAAGTAHATEKKRVDPLQPAIAEKILRFHVLANSDAKDDQNVKLKVRDAVGHMLGQKLKKVTDRAQTEKIVQDHMDEIIETAEKTLHKNGYTYGASARLANVDFPVKTYGDYTFPAGKYRALQITLGKGEGHNWWCVLYPNMCFQGSDRTLEQSRYNIDLVYIQNRDLAKGNTDGALGITCPNCGAPITNLGAKFCEYCGAGVVELNVHAWSFENIEEA